MNVAQSHRAKEFLADFTLRALRGVRELLSRRFKLLEALLTLLRRRVPVKLVDGDAHTAIILEVATRAAEATTVIIVLMTREPAP